MIQNQIRVLIVDDSPVVRTILADMLSGASGITLVGQAQDGQEAVELAEKLRPDVITMDIRMPRLDGLEATKRIMRDNPTPIVVVASSVYSADLNIAFNAVATGALTVVEKPKGLDPAAYEAVRDQLLATVRLVANVPVVALWTGAPASEPPAPIARPAGEPQPAPVELIAVAASTGGPGVLRQVLSALPGDFSLPMVVVQHITPGFGQGFARWLDSATPLQVSIAQDGELLRPGHVLLAPDDAHLLVTAGGIVRLAWDVPASGQCPSATRLFDSALRVYRAGLLAVVLSGMGDDGAAAVPAILEAGGRVLVQEASTCTVASMPQAARAQGAGPALAPEAIAAELLRLHAERLQARSAAPC
jgi:two-component system chemotaxis response regulator CheB